MSHKLTLIAVCALVLASSAPSRGQDSPSLGDIARQAQKDKANKPPTKVITNDDIAPKPTTAAPALAVAPGGTAQAAAAGSSDTPASPAEGLADLTSKVDELDSMDRATLAKSVLEGDDRNFPGRDKWEAQLFAAKQVFVAQNREVVREITQIEAAADGMKNVQDMNDPRVKLMNAKLQQLVQQTQQYADAFKAVVAEGKTLAGQTAAH